MALQADIIQELKNRGFAAKPERSLIALDLNPELGHSRSYTLEQIGATGNWTISLSEVIFDEDGEDNEEQTDIGTYATESEIADAIEECERGE